MIGVLIVTHGTIGESLLSSAAQILGEAPAQAAALGVSRSDDPDRGLARGRALGGEPRPFGATAKRTPAFAAAIACVRSVLPPSMTMTS